MYVEFDTVRSSDKELYEREINEELNGIINIPYEREYDYLAKVIIDISQVTGYESGKVLYNNQELDCIYAKINDEYTRNLLISEEQFKILFEKIKGIQIINSNGNFNT